MPGPISESYDPEFGTSTNADLVRNSIQKIVYRLNPYLGERKYIVDVAKGIEDMSEDSFIFEFSERELRLIRFALERSLDTI